MYLSTQKCAHRGLSRDWGRGNARSRLILCALALHGILFQAHGANLPPTVSAGTDAEYASDYSGIYLEGSVEDDQTPVVSLVIAWRQISGPAQADIANSAKQFSSVTFPQSGVYVFELRVSDGELSSVDTVAITIRESIPFKVLAPVNDEAVEIGKPFTIRWQREGREGFQVFCTMDSGLTWHHLTESGTVNATEFVWNVDPRYVGGTRGEIIVQKYNTPEDSAHGSFVLVDPLHAGRTAGRHSTGRPLQLSIDRRGKVCIRDHGRMSSARILFFSAEGRGLTDVDVDAQRHMHAFAGSRERIVCYRVSAEDTDIQSGILAPSVR